MQYLFYVKYGIRKLRIKKFVENSYPCYNCKGFAIEVKAFKHYCHLYEIPLYPFGDVFIETKCERCGEPNSNEHILQIAKSKTIFPFYLYPIPIILLSIFAVFFSINLYKNQQLEKHIHNPQLNDILLFKNDNQHLVTYNFNKVKQISKDSVFLIYNQYEYLDIPSTMDGADFFVKNSIRIISRKDLIKLYQEDIVIDVFSNYSTKSNFNIEQ